MHPVALLSSASTTRSSPELIPGPKRNLGGHHSSPVSRVPWVFHHRCYADMSVDPARAVLVRASCRLFRVAGHLPGLVGITGISVGVWRVIVLLALELGLVHGLKPDLPISLRSCVGVLAGLMLIMVLYNSFQSSFVHFALPISYLMALILKHRNKSDQGEQCI